MILAWMEDQYFHREDAVVLAAFEHWRGIDPNLTAKQLDERWIQLGKRALTGMRPAVESEAVQH